MNIAGKSVRFEFWAITGILCVCAGIWGVQVAAADQTAPGLNRGVSVATTAQPRGKPAGPLQKQPIAGLIDRQHTQWAGHDNGTPEFALDNVMRFPGIFGGIVLNSSWNVLQPSPNGELTLNTLDDALAQVRDYNARYPTSPLGVKLRIWAGANAPEWAKKLAGGPVNIVRNPAGCYPSPCPLTVGKFWAPAYGAAWRKFQTALAARYDSEPLIRQVAVTSCTQQTDEPFVPTVDAGSRDNLVAAGYTDAAQKKCLMNAIADYASWKTTLIDFSFNKFSRIAGGADPDFTMSVMKACRTALGTRCVLDNQALSVPLYAADQSVYSAMQSLGPPVQFQTAGPKAMDCQWTAVVAQGVALGAVGIEVWPETQYQGFDSLTLAQMQQLASEFTAPIPVPDVSQGSGQCPGFH